MLAGCSGSKNPAGPFTNKNSKDKNLQAREDFNFVPIGDYFVTISFISEVHRHLLDADKWDEHIGVESIIEQSFWRSLDDQSRNLIGPIVEFLKEHKEWFDSLRREIAASAAQMRGKHD